MKCHPGPARAAVLGRCDAVVDGQGAREPREPREPRVVTITPILSDELREVTGVVTSAVACLFNTVHRSSRTRSIPTASPDEGLEKRHLKEEKEKRSEPRATRCKHPGRGAGDEAGYRRNNTIHARSVPALQCVRRLGANRANCKREKNGNSIKYNNDFFFK